ncbi:MAG: 50S ribosomal protein L29 [Candidatus Levybacteria bacterium]|nr:50S ribosomal protein L29 [Candidatus Levybacteria bacterium]
MKSKDIKQLNGKTGAELTVDLKKVTDELTVLLLDNAQGKLKNTSSLRSKRKDIAIIKTKITQQVFAAKEQTV